MLLRLQNNIIYGPVASRRLGRSLGVNLLPFHQKTCTLDCLYCQYGWTRFSNLETAKCTPASILDWVDKIVEIKPQMVQIYTLDRGHPAPTIECLSRTELNHIRQHLSAEHIPAVAC